LSAPDEFIQGRERRVAFERFGERDACCCSPQQQGRRGQRDDSSTPEAAVLASRTSRLLWCLQRRDLRLAAGASGRRIPVRHTACVILAASRTPEAQCLGLRPDSCRRRFPETRSYSPRECAFRVYTLLRHTAARACESGIRAAQCAVVDPYPVALSWGIIGDIPRAARWAPIGDEAFQDVGPGRLTHRASASRHRKTP
jgi:hypothetical protein